MKKFYLYTHNYAGEHTLRDEVEAVAAGHAWELFMERYPDWDLDKKAFTGQAMVSVYRYPYTG